MKYIYKTLNFWPNVHFIIQPSAQNLMIKASYNFNTGREDRYYLMFYSDAYEKEHIPMHSDAFSDD